VWSGVTCEGREAQEKKKEGKGKEKEKRKEEEKEKKRKRKRKRKRKETMGNGQSRVVDVSVGRGWRRIRKSKQANKFGSRTQPPGVIYRLQ